MMKPAMSVAILVLAVLLARAQAAERVVRVDLAGAAAGQQVDLKALEGKRRVEWHLPAGDRQRLMLDLKGLGIDPRDYDEIRFDLKPEGSQVRLHLGLFHYPEQGRKSGWYLKTPAPEGVWTSLRYDLSLDDDGVYIGRPREGEEAGKMRLTLSRRLLGTPGEPKWRKAQIRDFRFVRHVVSADFRLIEAEMIDDAGEIGCLYRLHVKNETDRPQKVQIELDGHQTLKYFRVSGAESVELKPGEQQVVPVKVWMSRQLAMSLSPLYAEPLVPKVSVPGVPDSDVIPLRGYRRWPMWGVVPIFNRKVWRPAFVQALLTAREKAMPAIGTWRKHTIARADAARKHRWPVPTFARPGFDQVYRCGKCRTWLRPTAPTEFHKHKCPKCGRIWENDARMDTAWISRYNGARARNVHDLGLAWLLTGDREYKDKAVEILHDYATAYPGLEIGGARSTSGNTKLSLNSLHSSYKLPGFAEGYAFIRNGRIPEAKRAKIEHFLLDSATRIAQHSVEYSNQQAEHFRAYGTAGITLGFWPLAAEAIHGDFGWHQVVEYGYSSDGIAHEGGAYHRAVVHAMNELALFAWGEGVNLYTARFKRVFDGSLSSGAAQPSLELPYMVYGDPAYLKDITRRRAGGRVGLDTAMYAPLGVPSAESIPFESELMRGAGYVFLRKGTAADNMEIALNYVKQFDRHEHDRFTTFFKRNGAQIDSTAGRIAYSAPNSSWMLATAAHNTIVIDGASQRGGTEGVLVAWDPERPAAVVTSDPKSPFYEGVSHLRCIALIEDCYVVFDRVQCEGPRTVDRYQWGHGEAKFQLKEVQARELPHLPRAGAYRDVKAGEAGRELQVDWPNGLRMRLVSDVDMLACRALTIGGYQAAPREVTWVRAPRTGAVTFLAGFSYGKDLNPPKTRILKVGQQQMEFEVQPTGKQPCRIQIDVKAGTVRKTAP